jgi:hypothetical protein
MDKVPEDLEFHLRAVGEIYKKKFWKKIKNASITETQSNACISTAVSNL